MSNRSRRRGGRAMFEVRPGQHRPKNIRNGVVFVVLIALFMVMLYVKPTVPGFGKKGQEITADLTTGVNVRPGSTPIRVKGVEVGQVTKVERAPNGRGVRVTMLVEKGKGVEVHQDAKLAFRWRTLLGRNLYVDLQPGSPSAPRLAKSDVVPTSRTEVQTELDQAVEPFDATGRKSVKTIIEEFDKGFGTAKAYKATVKELGPATRELGTGLSSIRGTEANDLQEMIAGTSRVLGSVASSEVRLGDLIDNGSVALGVTAARSQDIRAVLGTAPGALSETRATMARLRTTLDTLDPVAAQLRPGSRELAASADDARTLLRAAAPLLSDAKPTVRALRPAVQDLLKLTTSGNALMAAANPVLDDAIYPILPFLRSKDVESHKMNYAMVGPGLSAAAAVTSLGDKSSTIANFEAGAGEGSLPALSPCQVYLTDTQVPLEKKVQCDAIAKILAAALTGTSPDTIQLQNRVAPTAKVNELLGDTSEFKSVVTNLLRNRTANAKNAQTKQEAGR